MHYKDVATLERLERVAKVIEYCLDGMMSDKLASFSHHVIRYNRWMEEFDNIIKHNLTMDTSNLKVSDFMRSVICHMIDMKSEDNIDFYYKKKRGMFVH